LDQEVFTQKLLETYGMQDCKPAPTPAAERSLKHPAALKSELDEKTDTGAWIEQYGAVVGSVSYLAKSTRPDIQHAASELASKLSKPTASDIVALKRLLRYLRGTAKMGLSYGGGAVGPGQGVLLAPNFCDSDWASSVGDRRSTTGSVLKVNGGTVSWFSKKQAVVALSSTEAEYIAMAFTGQEIVWLRALLGELGYTQEEATVLHGDNQPALAIAKDDVHHQRTKHIDIRHHWIRELIAAGKVRMLYVPSECNVADPLTKPLGSVAFLRLRAGLLGVHRA
jgi:hypothetical protein